MKKFAIMAILAASVVSASAAEFTVFTKYDYDNLSDVSGVSLQRGNVGASAGFGKFGTVDASLLAGRLSVPGSSYSDQGLEIGYSNGLTIGKFDVSARIGYAKLNETKADLLRTSAEVSYPLTHSIKGVAGVEHIRVEGDSVANRFTAGVDFAVAKAVTLRAVAARTNFTGVPINANGISLGASYKF